MSDVSPPEDLDARLGRALHELASGAPPDADVFARVASRRRRRETARRRRIAGASFLLALVFAGAALWVGRDDSESEIATRTSATSVRIAPGIAPAAAPGRAVPLRTVSLRPDPGYVTHPLLARGGTVALAAYPRDGTGYSFPPSRVVRVEPDGELVDQVDLQGEILDLADGEGARWVLTRDKEVTGPQDPEFRVKRIGPDGTVVSNAVPPGDVPAGDLVAAGGGVWLPVRDAVLRYDPVTGALAARVALQVPAERRGIADLGKFVAVTDGNALMRLDPASGSVSEVVSVGTNGVLIGLSGSADAPVLLAETTDPRALEVFVVRAGAGRLTLPGLPAAQLRSENGVTWVEGQRRGRPVVFVVRPGAVEVARTITLPAGRDVGVTFLGKDRLVIAEDGRLHASRITSP